MDNSPLNAAHYHYRRAQHSMCMKKYDDAFKHHSLAAELLEKALGVTTSLKAKDSIVIQRDYHLKQKEFVIVKKEFEEAKKKMEKTDQTRKFCPKNCKGERFHVCLKDAVNETMDNADSLLLFLVRKHHDSLDNQASNQTEVAYKEPKGDDVIIEELQIVNQQLRKLISQLCVQLEEVQLENHMLKMKIKCPCSDSDETVTETLPKPVPSSKTQPVVIASSTAADSCVADDSSPLLFSPCELSPDDNYEELKELPPLELPEFPDFESMIAQRKAEREKNLSNKRHFF